MGSVVTTLEEAMSDLVPDVSITTWRALGRPVAPGPVPYSPGPVSHSSDGVVQVQADHIEAAATYAGFCVVVLVAAGKTGDGVSRWEIRRVGHVTFGENQAVAPSQAVAAQRRQAPANREAGIAYEDEVIE